MSTKAPTSKEDLIILIMAFRFCAFAVMATQPIPVGPGFAYHGLGGSDRDSYPAATRFGNSG